MRVCVCVRGLYECVVSKGRLRWLAGTLVHWIVWLTGANSQPGQAHWQAGHPPTFSRFPLGYQTWDGRLGSLLVELQRLWGTAHGCVID